MNKIIEKFKSKNNQWLGILIVIVIIAYFGMHYIKEKIVIHQFFNEYNVLSVVGDNNIDNKSVAINGKIVQKNKDGWTNVLAIPNSLKYLTLTSSYSKSKDIECGDTVIPKKVEQFYDGENEWCISNNGKEMVGISSAQFYPYDENNTVYESCLKDGYYEAIDGKSGYNSCAERGLFLNKKQIATTKEKMGLNYQSNTLDLQEASSFNYYPSKKLGSSIFYTTEDAETYSYDILTEKTSTIRIPDDYKSKLEDIFLTDKGEIILVEMENSINEKIPYFLGEVTYNNQKYKDVYSAEYADSKFYVLRLTDINKGNITDLGGVITYELLKDGKKVANIEINSVIPYGYKENAIQQFPFCDLNTVVCIYENGHYAYKNRIQVPKVYGYDFYTEEMVIDGEWRGENIPNLIGVSKPIFEDDKLRYIVYAGFPINNGIYLIDFNKKWSFKDLYYKNGPATTKLLNGYQNKLLNVMEK